MYMPVLFCLVDSKKAFIFNLLCVLICIFLTNIEKAFFLQTKRALPYSYTSHEQGVNECFARLTCAAVKLVLLPGSTGACTRYTPQTLGKLSFFKLSVRFRVHTPPPNKVLTIFSLA